MSLSSFVSLCFVAYVSLSAAQNTTESPTESPQPNTTMPTTMPTVSPSYAPTTPPRLPALPTQFRATINCNIINKNYTVTVDEIYDGPSGRSLLTRLHPNSSTINNGAGFPDPEVGRTINLNLFDKGEKFHVNDTHCLACLTNQTDCPFGRGRPGQGNSIPSTQEFFQFGADFDEVYQGGTIIDGVPCNHWKALIGDWNSTSMMNMTVDYYFSAPEWQYPMSNWTESPVLVNLTGSAKVCTYGAGPPNCSDDFRTFAHVYSYSSFVVGPIEDEDDIFSIPAGMNCTGNYTVVPRSNNTDCPLHHPRVVEEDTWSGAEVGETVGIALGSGLLGAILASLIAVKVMHSNKGGKSHTTLSNSEFRNPNVELNNDTDGPDYLDDDSSI